jgi:hypothetical protein
VVFAVGVTTGYGAGEWEFKNFLFFTPSTEGEIKRPKREANQSHPNTDKVKKAWIYTSISSNFILA